MSTPFRSLVWREWRESRHVVLGCALVIVVLTVLVQHFVFRWREPLWSGESLVFLPVFLPAVLVAADLFAGDITSRRVDALALLPVSLRTVVAAKLTYLLGVIVVFDAFTSALNAALLAAFGGADWSTAFAEGIGQGVVTFAGLQLLIVGAVVLFSAMAFRSFVAVILGAALAGLLAFGFSWTEGVGDLRAVFDVPLGALTIGSAWAGALALLVLGVWTLLRAPMHTATRARLAALGLGSVAAVLLTSTAGVAIAVERHVGADLGEEGTVVSSLHVLPGDRDVVVTWSRQSKSGGPNLLSYSVSRVDRETGDGLRLGTHGTGGFGYVDDGSIALWRRNPFTGWEGAWTVDPRTGERIGDLDLSARGVVRDWMPTTPDWVRESFDLRYSNHTSMRVVPKPGVTAREITSKSGAVFLRDRGNVIVLQAERLLHLDLFDDAEPRLLAENVTSTRWQWDLSPSGTRLCVNRKDATDVIDLGTARVLESFQPRFSASWLRGPSGRDVLVTVAPDDPSKRVFTEFTADGLRETVVDDTYSSHLVLPLGSGGYVAIAKEGNRVVELSADGSLVRQLLPVPRR